MTLAQQRQPIDWKKVEDAIKEWCRIKSGFDDNQIQWEDQDLAEPPYPYISLRHDTFIKEGDQGPDELRTLTDLNQPAGQEIEMITLGPREFTLTVQVHADEAALANFPLLNPNFIATKLHAALGQQSVVDRLKLAGLSIIEEGTVLNTSITVNEIWTKRSTFDVRFRVMSFMSERTGYIDAIGGTGTINPGANQIEVDISVPVGTP